jgi:hypothetical protein
MFLLAFIKLLTNSENPFSNPHHTPCSGNCDHENKYRKPPVVLKMVSKAGYDVYTGKIDQ